MNLLPLTVLCTFCVRGYLLCNLQITHPVDENRYEDGDDDAMGQKAFDSNDERGLLLYADIGTNDFNDIWDDDNQWNSIQDVETWDDRSIKRKCLTIWKKRLCLCQFLGWLDGPEKYHCIFPNHENAKEEEEAYEADTKSYNNVQVKHVNPQMNVHHFHHIYGASKEIENKLELMGAYPPQTKPNWTPLWMWQQIQSDAQNEQISQVLFSARVNDEKMNLNEISYAYDEYLYDDGDADDEENDDDDDESMKQSSWIELSESATHDFDTEWENDEHWDEITEMKTWEGTAIQRKCLHLWKHRLCLCQFLGWMDTNKYKCIYHQRQQIVSHHMDNGRGSAVPIIEHVIGHEYVPRDSAQFAMHHFDHHGPQKRAKPRRKKKARMINMRPSQPIHWQRHPPVIGHHFHQVPDDQPLPYQQQPRQQRQPHPKPTEGRESHKLSAGTSSSEVNEHRSRVHDHTKHGAENRLNAERMREKEEAKREEREREREKKFQDILWKDRHNHKMWQLMKSHKPIYGKTASGRHMIVAQYINPHKEPMMVSMHKHMPNDREQWIPHGLLTNVKQRGSYMVHDDLPGDHSTVVNDERRFAHGSDLSQSAAAYDVYENYYFYEDEYDDELFDFASADVIDEHMDEFMDNEGDQWVISDIVNSLEGAFYNLFGNDDGYWDSMQALETKRGYEVEKQCQNVFDKVSCLCSYKGAHYHCNKKTHRRHKFYLDTRMPKASPQWMSAHDFEWLKDQRLSSFTEVLPDALMDHMQYNELFSLPFHALSKLVEPAVTMQHIE